MSQHDYNIANQGFPNFRTDLNNALGAIATNNSGSTAPTTTFAHQWWLDTSTTPTTLRQRNADNDAWVTIGTIDQATDTFVPANASSDKISEGNSSVEVVDTGTGYVVVTVDGGEVARFNPDQLVTKAGSASTPAISPTGDLNTGVFFPAADTIAFGEGGAEAMRIDSSGNVGIGTSSPLEKLQVAGPVVSTANLSALRASTMTMDYISGGRLIATGADSSTYSPIIFGTATTTTFAERGRFEANGNLKLALNLSVGSATPTTSGTGITFPATQSASTDANTLDDYEEGTFTPSLTFGGGSTGMTYSGGRTGTYVKIGKMVFCQCRMVLSAKGSSTGNASITGLPFTTQSVTDFVSGGSFPNWQNVTFTGQMFLNIGDNVSQIDIYNTSEAGTSAQLTHTNFSDTSRLSWSVVYLVP